MNNKPLVAMIVDHKRVSPWLAGMEEDQTLSIGSLLIGTIDDDWDFYSRSPERWFIPSCNYEILGEL